MTQHPGHDHPEDNYPQHDRGPADGFDPVGGDEPLPGQYAWQPGPPFAHEGGLPYGSPTFPPAEQPGGFVPQHLAGPYQQPAGFNGQYPQPGYNQPGYQAQGFPTYPYPHAFVVHQPRRVNHALHLVLSLISCGLWLPVWIILAIANS